MNKYLNGLFYFKTETFKKCKCHLCVAFVCMLPHMTKTLISHIYGVILAEFEMYPVEFWRCVKIILFVYVHAYVYSEDVAHVNSKFCLDIKHYDEWSVFRLRCEICQYYSCLWNILWTVHTAHSEYASLWALLQFTTHSLLFMANYQQFACL